MWMNLCVLCGGAVSGFILFRIVRCAVAKYATKPSASADGLSQDTVASLSEKLQLANRGMSIDVIVESLQKHNVSLDFHLKGLTSEAD